MQLRKYRWSRDYESAEEELMQMLARKKIAAKRWVGEPGQVLAARSYDYDKQLWCAEGSIVVTVGTQYITLQSGDALDIPAKTLHSGQVGFSGCACYE